MKKNIIILILIIIILCLCGFFVIDKINNNKNKEQIDNSANEGNNQQDNQDGITEYIGQAYSNIKEFNWPTEELPKESTDPDSVTIKINLPKILLNSEATKSINDKIYNDYNNEISSLESNTVQIPPSDIDISYEYTIKDNILFILIKKDITTYRSSGSTSYNVYYYDITNDKELSVDDICNIFNIKLEDIGDTAAESIYAVMNKQSNSFDIYYKQDSTCPSFGCIDVKTISIDN